MASSKDFCKTSFEKNVMGKVAIKGFSSKSVRILKHTYNAFVREFYRKIELKKKEGEKCLMCREIKLVFKYSLEKKISSNVVYQF